MTLGKVLPFPAPPQPAVTVLLWDAPQPPDAARLRAQLAAAGYQVVQWAGEPHQAHAPHAHIYPEFLWVLTGAVTLVLPVARRLLELAAGDRVELPAGTQHALLIGPDGAAYLLATK